MPLLPEVNTSSNLLHIVIVCLTLLTVTSPLCLSYFQYYDSVQSTCLPCQYNCFTCLDSQYCSYCVDEFYLDPQTNFCQKCPYGCKTCQDASSCITCNVGLYINSAGQCLTCPTGVKSCSIAVVQACHDGYFLLGTICAGCLDNCQQCEDFVTCSQCNVGYYLATNTQACISCSSNCEICTDSTTCTSCAKGYTISNNACVVQDCSLFPFCLKCTPVQCLVCQQGKYLDSATGTCLQGASILCQQSSGPYFTNCELDNYDCPDYAFGQLDPNTFQPMSVCQPYSSTQYYEYAYSSSQPNNCATATCGQQFSQLLTITTRKSYFKLEYNLNLQLYKSPTHIFTITALNTTSQTPIATSTHTLSIAQQLSTFAQEDCAGCLYGQVYVTGTLQANGYAQSSFNLSDTNAAFSVKEYVFKFYVCTVDKCQKCTTVSDCVLCVQPYLLQLVKCVTQCDAGFYKYDRYCLLSCPVETFPIQATYQCQLCTSPCLTCTSQTQCLSCVTGYYLQGTVCVQTCSSTETFGNSTSRECQPCPNPCSTCQAVTPTTVKCLSCVVGYLYSQGSCVFSCPLTLYNTFANDISQCATCDVACTSCRISQNVCEGCVSGYLLYETTCNQTASCKVGYFITTNNVCAQCQFPCAACDTTSTHCLSCLKGAFYNFQCLSTCPSGYFIQSSNIANITCSPCINNCLTCLSSTVCLTCSAGRFLYNSQCVLSCPSTTTYPNALNNTCTTCPPPCKSCTSATSCLSCSTGYLDGTTCTLNCNSSSYINANFECALCPTPCIQCYSSTQCTKCLLPSILYQSACFTQAACQALGKYVAYSYDQITKAKTSGQCRQCTYPCLTCNTSAIVCLSCVTNYLFIQQLSTCQQTCPSTYYQSSSNCLKCSSLCFQCSSTSTNCTSCPSGSYLHLNQCLTTCPAKYYGDYQNGQCSQCVTPCDQCYNEYYCKSCQVGIFYNKVCVGTCPVGTIYQASGNVCEVCTSNCLTCKDTTDKCLTCVSGFYLNQVDSACVKVCPVKYYADSLMSTCQLCLSPCQTCTSSTQCLTCITSYYLLDTSCLSSCPSSYFPDATTPTPTCTLCNLTICQTCLTTASNCLSCAINYFFDSTQSKCLLTCPSTYYQQPTTRTCRQCQYPCQQCTNTSYCTLCTSTYKLYTNRCYSSCPIGFYPNATNHCAKCQTNCDICSSQANCTKCSSGYYVENGACVLNCSIGSYKGKQDVTSYDYCMACQSNCLNCQDYNTCLQCTTSLYLFNGLCLQQCPILHYPSPPTLTCQPCPQNCLSCLNSTHCLQCINSYIYLNQCLSTCPSQTYPFNQQSCIPCSSPCLQCQSQYSCLTCVEGYFYYGTYCVKECPKDVWFYPHNATCAAVCPYNKYEEKKVCYVEGCGGRLVEMNGYCLSNCPIGYYVTKDESCQACEGNQAVCDNLFVADLQVLRSQQMTLSLYFNQKAQYPSSISEVNITFTDYDNTPVTLTLAQYSFTNYALTFKYQYQSVNFLNVYLTVPYLDSLVTQQAISVASYVQTVYYYNDYGKDREGVWYVVGEYVPLVMTIGLFLTILINIITKTSYFLQLLDFMQLIAATLYLQIQYPIFLQKFLSQLRIVLGLKLPSLLTPLPYTFSSPKFIFYNIDTSFMRTSLLLFIIFIILLVTMVTVLIINRYFKHLQKAALRIKYRNLNDLFSVLSFPLLLWSFVFGSSKVADVVLGVVVIVVTIGWIVFISNLIIQAEQMGDLLGLLSDYEPVSSKLGLMYTPFSFIRRFIVALVFCVFPQKPLAALTLLLIFTILILICLYFYQPFASQITDYVSMYLELTLILFILLIVIIGLDLMHEDGTRYVGVAAMCIVTLGMVVGLGWLIYLTVGGVKKYYQNPEGQNENVTEDCIKSQHQSQKQKSKQEIQHQSQHQHSASNLMRQQPSKHPKIPPQVYSQHSNSNKQQFKHWNDQQSQQQQQQPEPQKQPQNTKQSINRPPPLLMKKILQEKQGNQDQV